MESRVPYFSNHERRDRFPWSLYHRPLERQLARIAGEHGEAPRVLVVGCGLEPQVPGGPAAAEYWGCDLDPSAIARCRELHPALAGRLAVCPSPLQLPAERSFDGPFDLVVAKEVIEHIEQPVPWVRELARRVAPGGDLVLTTPNYGRGSTLALLERTVLEWLAQRDGYSRRHIHPSRFDRRRLATLDVGPGMRLRSIEIPWTGWTLTGRWTRDG